MTDVKKNRNQLHIVTIVILALLTLVAAVCKILVSLDIDEQYAIALGGKIAQGEILFRDLKDQHQTSSLMMGAAEWIFYHLTGSFTGVVIYTRVIATLLTFLYAYVFYRVMNRYYAYAWIPAFLVANYSYKGVMNLEFSFVVTYCFFWICLLLFELGKEWKGMPFGGRLVRIIVCALLYSLGVFAYPTMVVTVILIPFIFRYITGEWKTTWKGIGICLAIIAAIAGLGILVLWLAGVLPVIAASFTEMLSGGLHSSERSLLHALYQDPRSKQMWLVIAGAVLLQVFFWLKYKNYRYLTLHIMLVNSAIMFGYHILGLLRGNATTIQIRYVLILVAGLLLWSVSDKLLFVIFGLGGIGLFTGALLASNETLPSLIPFVFPCLVMLVVWVCDYASREENKVLKGYATAVLIVFVAALFVYKADTVRITGAGASNLAENRTRMQIGPYKGIYLASEEAVNLSAEAETIAEVTSKSDIITVYGTDVQLLNMCGNGSFSVYTVGGYNRLYPGIADFYNAHEWPNMIFFDKHSYEGWEEIAGSGLGERLGLTADGGGSYWQLTETDELYIIRATSE